jgi:hypothetical protein
MDAIIVKFDKNFEPRIITDVVQPDIRVEARVAVYIVGVVSGKTFHIDFKRVFGQCGRS